jgi:hypothetical protein
MMMEPEDKIVGLEGKSGIDPAQEADELPYCIELWKPDSGRVERVLGRAASVQLARAIFTSAQSEFPSRRITVRRGEDMVLDSER